MQAQTKISNFFTSPAPKRSSDIAGFDSISQENKIPKNHYQNEDTNSKSSQSSLSPEQKKRMEEKRLEAQAKLESKKGPQNFGLTWKKALAAEFDKEYFVKLSKFVESERRNKTVYPPAQDVFTWTQLCQINEVKVVILGQDPYHGPRQAHGLCFSVRPGVASPPSLVNIYKELQSDIDGFQIPKHGYLVGWARQGVLLLNAVLTVVASQANSHKDKTGLRKGSDVDVIPTVATSLATVAVLRSVLLDSSRSRKGWEKFTDVVIRWINTNLNGVVFMLWGAYAQKKGSFIDKKKHCVLKAVHPSPLSAHRGFLGCKHFSQANEYLKRNGKKAINWKDLPLE